VHAGSVDEFDHEQGVAHLVEHVTFLGSKKRERMLGTGARSNAYTDFHHTVFHMHAPVTTADGSPLLPQVRGRACGWGQRWMRSGSAPDAARWGAGAGSYGR
jgi:hypothetical protein